MKDSLDCVNCIVCIVDSLFVIVNAMRKESVAVVRCKLSFIELHKQSNATNTQLSNSTHCTLNFSLTSVPSQ